MTKIADSFCGYLTVGNDIFTYTVSNHTVTLLPAQSERSKRYEVFENICSRNIDLPEYLFGDDNNSRIAMLRNSKFNTKFLGLDTSIKFVAPIIIKSSGNTANFFNMLTEEWDKFHAITFCGGNINALCNPEIAVEQPRIAKHLKNDGAREIKIRPEKDFTRSVDFQVDTEKVTLTISVSQTGVGHMGAYNLGELNSYMQFSFENAQGFDKIEKYYRIAKSLTAILTTQNNISFDVYLSQKNRVEQYVTTGACKILDHYENYSARKSHRVIPIYNILDYVPNLVNKITNNEVDSLLLLLPEDNRRVNQISITNIQDLCTALEVAYLWSKRNKEKDKLIEELKKNIKKTISEFAKTHDEIDVYKETTLSSAFQYLDYTLKQKILTLYNEYCDMIDPIIAKWSLPQVNETNVTSFVKLRNNKTHSGTVEWNDSVNLYTALLALVYACFLGYIQVPNEIIKSALLQIF